MSDTQALISNASEKCSSWDPEIVVKVGDWGRMSEGRRSAAFIRKRGSFVRESNIYDDGKAKTYGIPDPIECGRDSEGEARIASKNAEGVDVSLCAGGIAQCKFKGAYKFSSGRGAVLAMANPMLTMISPPGALKRLIRGVIWSLTNHPE
ncbi:hypothetical protein C8R47DRAFT_1230627 [Mycena vitilis]|nr:hypothetical protein C8R47DRAFT_1230627 [Mycena vitilis]